MSLTKFYLEFGDLVQFHVAGPRYAPLLSRTGGGRDLLNYVEEKGAGAKPMHPIQN